jgi:hypothetical protein
MKYFIQTVLLILVSALAVSCGPSARTYELVTVANGNLVIRQMVEQTDGEVPLCSFRLYYKGRLVDVFGSSSDFAGLGVKGFPLNVGKKGKYLIRTIDTDKADAFEWHVWVNPKDFSRDEFEDIANLLLRNKLDILQEMQQKMADVKQRTQGVWWLQHVNLIAINSVIYADYEADSKVFTSRGATKDDLIFVTADGTVYQSNTHQQISFTTPLGNVIAEDSVGLSWEMASSSLRYADLQRFTNPSGKSFLDVYAVNKPSDN